MSDNRALLIYGSGQHGRVVAEAAAAADRDVLGFVDQAPEAERIGEWPVFNDMPRNIGQAAYIVAIGDNMARRRISNDIEQADIRAGLVIHPTAWVSPTAQVGANVYIGPQAVVNAGAQIDRGAIINSGAIIEHDCCVGAYTHVAPRAVLCGEVQVGELCLIGAGSVIKPRMRIGDGCTVGAGAVVIDHVPNKQTVVSVPAQMMAHGTSSIAG